jgi:hypothetical protein
VTKKKMEDCLQLHFVHGEKHSEEEVHANADSEDYPSGQYLNDTPWHEPSDQQRSE